MTDRREEIEPEYAATWRQWLWTKAERIWMWRGLILSMIAALAIALYAVVLVTIFDQNRILAENSRQVSESVAHLQAFTAEFATQNRLHRVDNHAENACALELLAAAFRNNPLYQDIPLPTIIGHPCSQLTVTETPPGLTITPDETVAPWTPQQ